MLKVPQRTEGTMTILTCTDHGDFLGEEWPWCRRGRRVGLHVSLLSSSSQGYILHLVPQEKSSGRTAHYKLTSTVMLWLQTNKSGSGTMNLGGSLTRQVGLSLQPLASAHWYQ